MLHTKTKDGMYDEHDYWTVSFTLVNKHTGEREEKVKKYRDVDSAYEDYCYYKDKVFYGDDHYITNCQYKRGRD